MLLHPILDKLRSMRLTGMVKAFEDQLEMPEIERMSFEDRLGLLVDREQTERASRQLNNRLRKAKLRQSACFEDIDFRHPRGLDKAMLLDLASCRWIRQHLNLVITGATGVGKSYIACALAHKACLEGFSARYFHMPKLQRELAVARGDGSYGKLLAAIGRIDVLVLDDFGMTPLDASERRDLYELMEDRHELRSTIVTSQLPVKKWHRALGDPTIADAVLDRLISNAHRLDLDGESIRPKRFELANRRASGQDREQ